MIADVKPEPRKRGRGERRLLRRALWAVALLAVAVLVWCGSLYYRIVTFDGSPSGNYALRADVGIVLGASLWNDQPSPGLKERLDQALTLYRAGAFSRFIVTGGLDAGGATITEAEGMRNYLMEKGVPENAIYMDMASRSTYENLLFAQDIMGTEGFRSAVIVTHSYHGARAADIAKSLGFDPVQVSVTETKVMMKAYHEARDTLAFAKWQLTKLRLAL